MLDPFTIPGQDWAFQTAPQNGEFIQFYKGLLAKGLLTEGPIDFISEYVDSDNILAKRKKCFKYRLEWVISQRSGTMECDTHKVSTSMFPAILSVSAVTSVLVIIFAKVFCKNERSRYSPIGNAELD